VSWHLLFCGEGQLVDFCFNNSIILLAFIVVVVLVAISLVILARDVLFFFLRRLGKRPVDRIEHERREYEKEHEE